MPKLTVLIASTRPGRAALPIAQWFIGRAQAHGSRFDVGVADLAELKLPLMDDPNHPRLRRYTQPHAKAWSATVEASDAFVFVTAEHNHGSPAPLKNAIDTYTRSGGTSQPGLSPTVTWPPALARSSSSSRW